MADLSTRWVTAAEAAGLAGALALLSERSALANPHALAPMDGVALAAFDAEGALAGWWPVVDGWTMPGVRALIAPRVPLYEVAGHPLLAPESTSAAANALIVAALEKRALVKAGPILAAGPFWDALQALAARQQIALTVVKRWSRAMMERSAHADAEAALAAGLSAASRKRLRQKRRALADLGDVAFRAVEAGQGFDDAFRGFLKLEQLGWKGRRGTALMQIERDLSFVRSVMTAMAGLGRAYVVELVVDGRAIAAGLLLRSGGECFFWKTAYDETLGRLSPGVLLDIELTHWLWRQPWFRRLDTATDDSIDPASLIWPDRRPMAEVLIERAGGSWRGHAARLAISLKAALKRRRAPAQAKG